MMIKKIWRKICDFGLWVKEKTKKVLVSLGILGVAAASTLGTQTNLLQQNIIDYPLLVNTDIEKLEYSTRAEELLRQWHNEEGAKFRRGEISEQEWGAFLEDQFKPRSRALGHENASLRESLKLVIPQPEGASSSTEPGSILRIEDQFRSSLKYEIDIMRILK